MKAFFKQLVASFFGSCFSVGAIVAVLIFGGIALAGAFFGALGRSVVEDTQKRTALPDNAMLVIDLSRGFSDVSTFAPANTAGMLSDEKGRFGLLDTIRALVCAQTDERIVGVLLIGTNGGGDGGFATREELRRSIAEFRDLCGKPVISYLPVPTYRDYYLATAGDEIWIHPFAELPINGLASSHLYYKGLLDKIGVGVQVTRVGTHKSAVEPLISESMSAEDREQRIRLTNEVWDRSLTAIALDRGKIVNGGKEFPTLNAARESPFVQTLLQKVATVGLVPAPEAVEARLVDAALYEDEMIERLKKIAGTDDDTHSFRQIALEDYLRDCEIAAEPPLMLGNTQISGAPAKDVPADDGAKKPIIAVLFAEGEIVDGFGSSREVGGLAYARALRDLRNNDDVKAVVFRIDSPGGSVFASEQIRREAELLAQKKPLVVSMGDLAASGGYWISTPARKVFANANTITGSIGVFGVLFNFENLGKKIGVNSEAVLAAPLAEIETMRRPKNETELAVLQKLTEQIYGQFIALVAKARNLPVERVDEIAQGQVWTGANAKERNLIDEFGGLVEAFEFARSEAGVGDDFEIMSVPGEINRYQELFDKFGGNGGSDPVASAGTASAGTALAETAVSSAANPALKAALKNIYRIGERLRAFNDPNNVYARLPFDVEADE